MQITCHVLLPPFSNIGGLCIMYSCRVATTLTEDCHQPVLAGLSNGACRNKPDRWKASRVFFYTTIHHFSLFRRRSSMPLCPYSANQAHHDCLSFLEFIKHVNKNDFQIDRRNSKGLECEQARKTVAHNHWTLQRLP